MLNYKPFGRETSGLTLVMSGIISGGTKQNRYKGKKLYLYANNCPTRCNYTQFIYICKPLYMFREVSPPIIKISCHYIYSTCH